eukprot:6475630-Amphidinium_carterae.1
MSGLWSTNRHANCGDAQEKKVKKRPTGSTAAGTRGTGSSGDPPDGGATGGIFPLASSNGPGFTGPASTEDPGRTGFSRETPPDRTGESSGRFCKDQYGHWIKAVVLCLGKKCTAGAGVWLETWLLSTASA